MLQPLAQQVEKIGELAEDQRLVATGGKLAGKSLELLHLFADQPQLGGHEAGIACRPAQPGEFSQHMEGLLRIVAIEIGDPFARSAPQGFEELALAFARLDTMDDFSALGQVGKYLGFGASKQKRTDETTQSRAGRFIALPFDGAREALIELARPAQQTRVEQIHD